MSPMRPKRNRRPRTLAACAVFGCCLYQVPGHWRAGLPVRQTIGRGIAQPGRALPSGGRGRRFESSFPDQHAGHPTKEAGGNVGLFFRLSEIDAPPPRSRLLAAGRQRGPARSLHERSGLGDLRLWQYITPRLVSGALVRRPFSRCRGRSKCRPHRTGRREASAGYPNDSAPVLGGRAVTATHPCPPRTWPRRSRWMPNRSGCECQEQNRTKQDDPSLGYNP